LKKKFKQAFLGISIALCPFILPGCDELGEVLSNYGKTIIFNKYEIYERSGSPNIYVWVLNKDKKKFTKIYFNVNLWKDGVIKKSVGMWYEYDIIPNQEVRVGDIYQGFLYPLTTAEARSCRIEYSDIVVQY